MSCVFIYSNADRESGAPVASRLAPTKLVAKLIVSTLVHFPDDLSQSKMIFDFSFPKLSYMVLGVDLNSPC